MQAKIKTLLEQVEKGNLKSKRAEILDLLADEKPKTINDICYYISFKNRDTLVARLSELEDMGLIYKKGVKSLTDTYYTMYQYEPDETKQAELRNQVKLKKFEAWKKRGVKQFSELLSDELKELL